MMRVNPPLPFTTRALKQDDTSSSSPSDVLDLNRLLPASHRTKEDHIVPPSVDIDRFFARELRVDRLGDVRDWLWVCGRPMPPRALHHQILLGRDITITENPDLHLVWHKERIFLKPLPAWLLDPDVWARYLLPPLPPAPSSAAGPRHGSGDADGGVAACARGLLFSYTALIAYHSDYRIAKEKGLIPEGLEWDGWQQVAREYLQDHSYASVHPRYWYGELRLSRLNKVYRFARRSPLRGYSKVAAHTVYIDLLRDNFGVLAGLLGYVVIVLSAMQVGLGVDRLQADSAFQSASYGFTVFSLLAPLVAGAAIVVAVLVMVVSNWLATKDYERKRFRAMGVEPSWQSQPGKESVTSSLLKGVDTTSSGHRSEEI